MKKLKIILSAAAIVMAVGAALATKPQNPCYSLPQYQKVGSEYFELGPYGVIYTCTSDPHLVCTYYYVGPVQGYKPCREGKLIWIVDIQNRVKKVN